MCSWFPPSQAGNYRVASPPLPLLWQLARRKPDVAARKLGYGLACCTGLPADSLVTALFRAKPHGRQAGRTVGSDWLGEGDRYHTRGWNSTGPDVAWQTCPQQFQGPNPRTPR